MRVVTETNRIRNFCIEAQTLANFHLARDAGLAIIPALNKIDLPQADPEETAREVGELVGWDPQDVLRISAKTGRGVAELLQQVIELVPAPHGQQEDPLRALVFDSTFDARSEEHTSELQSHHDLVCRL